MYTQDGNEITKEQIAQAVEARRAVIRWGHIGWANVAGLLVLSTPEEAEREAEKDTRGECYSMWEEVWSELATDTSRAIKAACGRLRSS